MTNLRIAFAAALSPPGRLHRPMRQRLESIIVTMNGGVSR